MVAPAGLPGCCEVPAPDPHRFPAAPAVESLLGDVEEVPTGWIEVVGERLGGGPEERRDDLSGLRIESNDLWPPADTPARVG